MGSRTASLSLVLFFSHGAFGVDEVLLSTGKIITAWTETPTKWYPLPLAVGALLLVALQYRKKVKQAQKEVHLDENGVEVVKLKGPWHVCPSSARIYVYNGIELMRYTGSCARCSPSTKHVPFVGIYQFPRVARVD